MHVDLNPLVTFMPRNLSLRMCGIGVILRCLLMRWSLKRTKTSIALIVSDKPPRPLFSITLPLPPSLPFSDVSVPPGLCIGALIARQHANVKDDVIEQL